MDNSLTRETESLVRSWAQHDAAWLRDYLVSGVEDPRINLQSVLSRQFLLENVFPGRFGSLMREECRFAAAINSLLALLQKLHHPDDLAAVLHALKLHADNAEGIELSQFLIDTFARLPVTAGNLSVPNYMEEFVSGTGFENGRAIPRQPSLDTFRKLWNETLSNTTPTPSGNAISVLEPACGSANDYRFLKAYGIASFLDYTGFDLSEKNMTNARALFPAIHFEVGNVFDIKAPDKSFDLCFVHDLFEHLSLEGMETAVKEVCRVTRRALCVGFFSMDEIRDHYVRQVEEYHWNTLSMARMKDLFAELGFAAQVIHIGTFLRQEVGCEYTHNPNAYTFFLQAVEAQDPATSQAI